MRPTEGITFLPTADLAATRRFYEDALGLTLRLDQKTCLIFEVTRESCFGFCQAEQALSPSDGVVLTLVTDHVLEWHARLTERGIPTDGPPRENPRFQIFHFYTSDPNGYLVEVQRFLDPRW